MLSVQEKTFQTKGVNQEFCKIYELLLGIVHGQIVTSSQLVMCRTSTRVKLQKQIYNVTFRHKRLIDQRESMLGLQLRTNIIDDLTRMSDQKSNLLISTNVQKFSPNL